MPTWLAAMVQVPGATPLTVLPDTLQMPVVVEERVTARPEVAVALALVAPPTASEAGEKPMAPMVWLPWGVTELEAAEAAPVPALLVALTVKV